MDLCVVEPADGWLHQISREKENEKEIRERKRTDIPFGRNVFLTIYNRPSGVAPSKWAQPASISTGPPRPLGWRLMCRSRTTILTRSSSASTSRWNGSSTFSNDLTGGKEKKKGKMWTTFDWKKTEYGWSCRFLVLLCTVPLSSTRCPRFTHLAPCPVLHRFLLTFSIDFFFLLPLQISPTNKEIYLYIYFNCVSSYISFLPSPGFFIFFYFVRPFEWTHC